MAKKLPEGFAVRLLPAKHTAKVLAPSAAVTSKCRRLTTVEAGCPQLSRALMELMNVCVHSLICCLDLFLGKDGPDYYVAIQVKEVLICMRHASDCLWQVMLVPQQIGREMPRMSNAGE
eukprot:CAMPEP_0197624178 /NCGR_PEP_ID=MMETSP1338-20131121/3929_1 /TAXON_ID=43686 ORGANISM="Pelagodinium beii, Strain RCC1491" /NCGR_SAMPLE_ID=MMETSP1338 /ASSEMBLY_ACC=CAM_ASM_000754 /LENGTH=118 /DNA_ID=CAMNT_0043194283 /DNA_START=919 /DNA_END=1275 /DNA_ORIENTATION=-